VPYSGETSNRSQGTLSEDVRCKHDALVLAVNPDTKYCYARCLRCLFMGRERPTGEAARKALLVLGARG
jgi:phosphoribosyl-AMP cyclohydrolase